MKIPSCKICGSQTKLAFTGLMLKRHQAEYYNCPRCGYLFVYQPHWLEEAYSNAIAGADTGLVYRNNLFAEYITRYLVLLGKSKARCLDLSGGTGLFTRLMRDNGFDYFWDDPYCENIHARGFEYKNLPTGTEVQVITAFEVLEHLEDPVNFIKRAFLYPGTEILIVSTELFNEQPPALDTWHYYMPETGQHIGFFKSETLVTIAKLLNLHLTSFKHLHVFSRSSVSNWKLRVAQFRPNPMPIPFLRKWLGSRVLVDHQELLTR